MATPNNFVDAATRTQCLVDALKQSDKNKVAAALEDITIFASSNHLRFGSAVATCREMSTRGACAAVISALQTFPADPQVQRWGCAAAHCIQAIDPTTAPALAEASTWRAAPHTTLWINRPYGPKGGIYDGHMANGKREGHGIYQSKIKRGWNVYEGGWINDLASGFGTKAFAKGDRYVGHFHCDKRSGIGWYTWANKDRYEGNWHQGMMHGQGRFEWAKGDVYDGEWVMGKMHGQGTKTMANKDTYCGCWKFGKADGHGIKTFASGDKHEGEYVADKREGQGKYWWTNGDFYDGGWKNGRMSGKGKKTMANGDMFEGEWSEDKAEGYGTKTFASGDYYKGNFVRDKRDGHGTYVWANGDSYEGNWDDGEQSGRGTYTYANGNLYDGNWSYGRKEGKGLLHQRTDYKGTLKLMPKQTAQSQAPVGSGTDFIFADFGTRNPFKGATIRVQPELADGDLTNAERLDGVIAVTRRGSCTFVEKARRAMSAGAIALVIINTDDEIFMPGSDAADDITIPVVMVPSSSSGSFHDDNFVTEASFKNASEVKVLSQVWKNGEMIKEEELQNQPPNWPPLGEHKVYEAIGTEEVGYLWVKRSVPTCWQQWVLDLARPSAGDALARVESLVLGRGRGVFAGTVTGVSLSLGGKATLPHGRGRLRWANGDEYFGGFIRGVMFGRGAFRYGFDGSIFIGHWVNGLRHGEGIFIDGETGGVFRGIWADGQPVDDSDLRARLHGHIQEKNRFELSNGLSPQQPSLQCACITDKIAATFKIESSVDPFSAAARSAT